MKHAFIFKGDENTYYCIVDELYHIIWTAYSRFGHESMHEAYRQEFQKKRLHKTGALPDNKIFTLDKEN